MRVWAMPVPGSAGVNLTADPATGRIESPRLQPGRYYVSLSAPGFGTVAVARLRLAVGQTWDLGTVRLEPPGSLVVRLRGRNGLIVSGGGVVAESSRGTVWARPDGAGVTRFGHLQPGRHVVVVGGWPWRAPPTAAASVEVTVESGEETTVEIPETLGHVRRLRVEGLSSADAVGLSLRVHREGGSATLLTASFGDGGRAAEAPEVEGAFAPGRYVAEATTADGRTARATFDVTGDGEPAVVVEGFR
jgi:hypothetical protein